tara:strand:- start:909 stop:1214 length:306 start_codon:yes stop_codon:yes gene_type:complete
MGDWNPNMDEAPHGKPLLGRQHGAPCVMIWLPDSSALNAAISERFPNAEPAQDHPAGWFAWACGLVCRKPDGTFYQVFPEMWAEITSKEGGRLKDCERPND